MSHLNEQLSALVDSELTGTELDRVNAHLAGCEQCRAEAAALRLLKRELRGLAAARPSDDLTRRLVAMAGPGGPVPPRRPAGTPRPRPAFRAYPGSGYPGGAYPGSGRSGPGGHAGLRPDGRRSDFADRTRRPRPGGPPPPGTWTLRKRSRYVLAGAISFVVTVGLGIAALTMGSSFSGGTRMTPQMELFSIAHAFSGTIPRISPGQQKPSWTSPPTVTSTP